MSPPLLTDASPMRAPVLLVTGISGYLGQAIARHPAALVFTRRAGTFLSQPISLPGWELHQLDVTDPAAVAHVWDEVRPTHVIHTAANFRDPRGLVDSIVLGTRAVLEASISHGARLLHLSTDMVFDGEHAPYREDAPVGPLTPYAHAKVNAEALIEASSLPSWVIVRTSLVTGLQPIDPRTQWVIDSVRQHKPITLFTDEFRCPVWVDDLAGALLELAQHDYRGIIHIAGPQRLSRDELGNIICRWAGLDPTGITKSTVAASGLVRPRDCTLDISLAQRLLKVHLRSIDEGLQFPNPQPQTPTKAGTTPQTAAATSRRGSAKRQQPLASRGFR